MYADTPGFTHQPAPDRGAGDPAWAKPPRLILFFHRNRRPAQCSSRPPDTMAPGGRLMESRPHPPGDGLTQPMASPREGEEAHAPWSLGARARQMKEDGV